MDKYNASPLLNGFIYLVFNGFAFGWSQFEAVGHGTNAYLLKIGFVVVISNLITYLLNLITMKELKPTTVVFIYLQPFFATVFAIGLRKG
jgi:hypothetical protein